jgi:hypothetical protein
LNELFKGVPRFDQDAAPINSGGPHYEDLAVAALVLKVQDDKSVKHFVLA